MGDGKANVTAATDGILPAQAIRRLVVDGAVKVESPVAPGQIQPASIDLRLGAVAHRVRASFLPGPQTDVRSRLR
ncbi:MAG: 2'-deoxycytidine 5'-triphosphate deaminase, partial [Proteobacteria bacterium]|nr:2'-deoxycytidine 5'-triphosphate deaminase [Pseudomonadota bacterium]